MDIGQEDLLTAVKDSNSALPLFSDLGEDLVPVGSSRDGPRFQARDQISFFLENDMI